MPERLRGLSKKEVFLRVNGIGFRLEVPVRRTLLSALRNDLGLTSVKRGCEAGMCGSCTVLLNGLPVYSCLMLAVEADGASILTVEGLGREGQLTRLQEAFAKCYSAQCGYCTPAMILSAKALLDRNPRPSEQDVRLALSGNLCRCTGYSKIIEAVLRASEGGI